jgi:concanavalin A-like lectin/glucanase superfamily protein
LLRDKTHPLGQCYPVADTYDGKIFRSYVNGEMEGEAEIAFTPHGSGAASVGARINKMYYFHGAVAKARFTIRELPVSEFMKLPVKK